ncbi:anti-sigma regulatory factor (Ser/Thr protein kinase) [Amycolatopsis bartoniae]|uniref:Anti-sigma regulatory factor n=1 Tax=Amycolatopsis bartoniae TaxID=941986 RepID=A0A8H9MAY3_9PSEU|nr:ATP-binding protein [Amycolatopsis bartoniae]MBB2937069.1 anti-sigma regulatory factor (Ser/Thr protein kinase) [Amycolatopsis bartoniae]TVT04730.1 ATP-binding protein [Amycolatopsis bartoniae]GHF52220.1 anti-sigma regulatory factor [Amycolatopsis bartoniae]
MYRAGGTLTGERDSASGVFRVRRLGTHLPPAPRSPAEARTFVADALRSWDVPGDKAGDIVLAASELVTNAFEHGSGGIAVRLRLAGDSLLLEVRDCSPDDPVLRRPQPESVRGRGLALIQALSSTWGHRRGGDGKWVWAEFDLS